MEKICSKKGEKKGKIRRGVFDHRGPALSLLYWCGGGAFWSFFKYLVGDGRYKTLVFRGRGLFYFWFLYHGKGVGGGGGRKPLFWFGES